MLKSIKFLCSRSNLLRFLSRAAALTLFLSLLFALPAKLPASAAVVRPTQAATPKASAAAPTEQTPQTTETLTGWQEVDGARYYYDASGKPVTGWQTIDRKKFYFMDEKCAGYTQALKGRMATGWQRVDGNFYYFTDSLCPSATTEGQMLVGLKTIGGNKYYLGTDGIRRTGFQVINGKKYYFADYRCSSPVKGIMMKGLQDISGRFYFFSSSGVMQTGWVQHDGVREYFGSNGLRYKPLVVLDPGHSSDVAPGTVPLGPGSKEQKAADTLGTRGVSTGVYEYKLTLLVSRKLKTELEARGYQVKMTRNKIDGTYSCVNRAAIANRNNADAFVRIHANAYSNSARTGAMTICITKNNPYTKKTYQKSQLLSARILNAYCKATGCRREHVWETDTMAGNNWSKVPTTLIEMGYMTNPAEDKLMQTAAYQTKMVQGIANGLDYYFNEIAK